MLDLCKIGVVDVVIPTVLGTVLLGPGTITQYYFIIVIHEINLKKFYVLLSAKQLLIEKMHLGKLTIVVYSS